MIDFNALKAPFPPDRVEWRVGKVTKDKKKGIALAYIDSRAVMERLDDVCGPSFWQCRYPIADQSSEAYSETRLNRFGDPEVSSRTLGKTVCEIGILIERSPIKDKGTEWVWKADGAGDTDFEAEKGALSDAFKRAAVKWGIGRYLYDMPAPWVEIDDFKKIVPHELERLMGMLPNAKVGVNVNGVSGLSKIPAKFWEQSKLIEPFKSEFIPKEGETYSQEALRWWYSTVIKKIDKAPTRAHLAQYQADNQHITDLLPSSGAEAIREAFEVRAQQFDQFGD